MAVLQRYTEVDKCFEAQKVIFVSTIFQSLCKVESLSFVVVVTTSFLTAFLCDLVYNKSIHLCCCSDPEATFKT